MEYQKQLRIPATYIRGGTSKGVFFALQELPEWARTPGSKRDQLLMRVIGSPDPYEKQIDGMGGATSSTSKIVIVSPSEKPDHDVTYLFGQVSINKALVDWSGNCGNLSSAVGGFAIQKDMIDPEKIPRNGFATVRIWQANIEKTIVARVPVVNGEVQEDGDFELDGVTFPAAQVSLEFVQPVDPSEALFPTGNIVDTLEVPGVGTLQTTMISAGIPTVFVRAADIGMTGRELQDDINSDPDKLRMFETIRAHGALRMGLIDNIEDAEARQHTPKVAFVAQSDSYVSSSGKTVAQDDIDVLARALSMGKLHHAMMGTAAVAIASAAAVPGTIVEQASNSDPADDLRFGHPSGTLTVGASASEKDGHWQIESVKMSRSARTLMEGWVRVPASVIEG